MVFDAIPPNILPNRGFKHIIELQGSKPVITTPYQHPKMFMEYFEKTIKDLLEMGHITPNKIPFSSLMVLVKNKDGTLRMYID